METSVDKMFIRLMLLLSSGCLFLCSHISREYHYVNQPMTWEEARNVCRQTYTDLAMIGNHDDMKRLVNMSDAMGLKTESWIGLRMPNELSWLWSVGEIQSSRGLTKFTNWATEPNSSHCCGSMGQDGKWLSTPCETKLPFVCQEEKESGSMHVVLQEKSWREAQEYCRLNYKDLATVTSQNENQALYQTVEESGSLASLVWIGLFKDRWKWAGPTDSSFRFWESGQPNNDGYCALYNHNLKKMMDRGCAKKINFYCYEATKRAIHIMRLEIKLNSHLNFMDPSVSDAILKGIQDKNKGVKLQWRVQPDGKIFHELEKKKTNETDEC